MFYKFYIDFFHEYNFIIKINITFILIFPRIQNTIYVKIYYKIILYYISIYLYRTLDPDPDHYFSESDIRLPFVLIWGPKSKIGLCSGTRERFSFPLRYCTFHGDRYFSRSNFLGSLRILAWPPCTVVLASATVTQYSTYIVIIKLN